MPVWARLISPGRARPAPPPPHTLRRTFGLALSEAGVEQDVIGVLLGHVPSGVPVSQYVQVRWPSRPRQSRLDYQRTDGTASDSQLA